MEVVGHRQVGEKEYQILQSIQVLEMEEVHVEVLVSHLETRTLLDCLQWEAQVGFEER